MLYATVKKWLPEPLDTSSEHATVLGGRVNVRRLLPLPLLLLLLLLLMAPILRSLHNTCAGGIEPACTDAPDGARPRGERKDALDTSVA